MAQSDSVWFRANDETRATLKQRAAAEGVSMNAFTSKFVEAALAGADHAPPSDIKGEITLDAAARKILEHADRGQAELILDLCEDVGREPADYLLSYLQLIHERGETATLMGERGATDTSVAKPVLGRETVAACAYCHGEFKVERRGQKYCPDPEDGESCGRKAYLDDLHRRRPQSPVAVKPGAESRKPADFSPPQVNTVQYQRVMQQQQEAARAAQ